MEQATHYLALRGHRREQLAADVAQRFVQDRMSVHDLASQLGRRPAVVRRLLDEAGIYDASRTMIGTDDQQTARNVARRYAQVGSISALVRETGMDKRVIRSMLVGAGVPLPTRHSLTDSETEQIAARYLDGASIRQLAKYFGASYGTVRAALLAARVKIRPRGRAFPVSARPLAVPMHMKAECDD
jgi:hypothetical protein